MKKYAIFMFAALLMFASTMKAQENKEKKAKGPSIEVRIEKMATDLALTDAEKATVKTLLEKQDAEKKQFMKDNDKESADFKPKMKELQKKQSAELKVAIGDEKFQKLQALRAEEKKAEKKAE
jgi:Skp family chaperone for outer membrane proteins